MQKQNKISILIAVFLVVAAALSKVIMFPFNFSPMLGMAVFAGATFTNKKLAFALPIFSMLLSDVLLEIAKPGVGFWGWGQLVGYGIFALITIFAFTMKKINVINVLIYSVSAAVIFYILSNLSYFFIDNPAHLPLTYTQDFKGFIACYTAALPFLKISLEASVVYSAILFGTYYAFQNYAAKKAVA